MEEPSNSPTDSHHASDSSPSLSSASEGDSADTSDTSNMVLKYISEMLMEEDREGKPWMLQDSFALQAAEKSFYDVLGQKYPPSPNPSSHPGAYQSADKLDDHIHQRICSGKGTVGASSNGVYHQGGYESSNFQTSFIEPQVGTPLVPNSFSDIQATGYFRRGTGEASSLVFPNTQSEIVDVERNQMSKSAGHGKIKENVVGMAEEEGYNSSNGSTAKKSHQREHGGDNLEWRSNKYSAVYRDDCHELEEMFDKVLLYHGDNDEANALRGYSHVGGNGKLQHKKQRKGSGKTTGYKKQNSKEEDVVDLWTLLTQCAQAAASYDQRTATKLLNQIREHSSVNGDATQRVAHYFANGLEARLAGIGTPSFSPHVSIMTSSADILRAYQLYVTACPFKRMSNFFANRTILKLSKKARTIHIIDFGILHGFQWPCLIQHLSQRAGGPPKLRITGIEVPQPGFRPLDRVEETGRRLENYCKRFNVPAEFKVVAQKWETIRVEDLNINRDEFTVVNCLGRLKHTADETVMINNPRDTVLKLMRSINPDVFIGGFINGTFNSPFFVTRFREALFHFYSLFDMLEASVPRDNAPRMLFESAIYGREIMNVIGCEGTERVVRPETYKQWQARITKAGFKQMQPNQEIVEKIKSMVTLGYHKDFVVDEQGQWLLQGWKGRTIVALSCWKPA
ncbi:hypothetical protein FNV43_RR05132 [Rhamnella rubrinervis]|uniref:Uncharacterized protein n=1 Tax=Rhamnella rubrinervis TaxID=2594499 RepID=A0A8K0MQT0_9ROSA|nr:hypothetical protein FNV43_RR05132 [Rhamnella rubrinervis]